MANISIEHSETLLPAYEHGELVISSKGVVGMIVSTNVKNRIEKIGDIKVVAFYKDEKPKVCSWKASLVTKFKGTITISQ